MSSNDPVVSGMLFAVRMLIRSVEWSVEPASEEPADEQAAEFLRSNMTDMTHSWADFIDEVMSMLAYGFSYHEIVYKIRKDGRVGWKRLPIRAQDTLWEWCFDEAGTVTGMVQMAPPDYKVRHIPISRALLFRTSSHKNNPEGVSILRGAYRPWFLKKHIENIEAIGIERDLAGLPIAYVPPELLHKDATPAQKAVLADIKKIVRNIRRDEQEGLVFPQIFDENGNKLYDFQLLSSGSRRNFDTNAVITRYDQRILVTSLADFILLGHDKVGSFALSSSKTEMFALAVGAWLDAIAEILNRFAVPRLFNLNTFPIAKPPKFVHGDIESADLGQLGDFITKLAAAGAPMFPDPELENHLRRQAGLPATQEVVAQPAAAPAQQLPPAAQPNPAPAAAAGAGSAA